MVNATKATPLKCRHCPTTTFNRGDAARTAGWRMFQGTSVTGKELDDVVCPRCGGIEAPLPPDQAGWLVRCNTCDWQTGDDGEDLETGHDAESAARDHECEPRIEVAPPGPVRRWFDSYDLTKGQVRPDARPLSVDGPDE